MRALVTGGTGLVGSHLAWRLSERGDRVRALIRSPASARALEQQEISFVVGDLLDVDSLKRATQDIDVVYHCAARVALPYQGNRRGIFQVNVEGTANLLEACAATGVGRFVFTSSVAVYGEVNRERVSEEQPWSPQGPYAESKALAERLVGEFRSQRGLEATTVRPCIIYGPGDRNFLPQILETLSRHPFPLVNGGDQPLDMVYVTDVAEALVLAGTRKEAAGEAYNVTDGEHHTLREIADIFGRIVPIRLRTIDVSYPLAYALSALIYGLSKVARPKEDPLISPAGVRAMAYPHHYDISKIVELGYEPKVRLEDGMRRTLEWYSRHRSPSSSSAAPAHEPGYKLEAGGKR